MLEVFWICFIIFAIILILRFAGPNVIVIIALIVGWALFKACQEMKEEERKREEYQMQRKKHNEEEYRKWQEMHGIYKENVYE